ncbi:hypothetical protein GCM10010400_64580 [Streptomyces aculeolatus]
MTSRCCSAVRVVGIALAWPSNEIAVMGAEGAANIIFRREINASADPAARSRNTAPNSCTPTTPPNAAWSTT